MNKIINSLSNAKAVNVLAFAFGWGILWGCCQNNLPVIILSNILFLLYLIASYLYRKELKKYGKSLHSLKPDILTTLLGGLWITGVIILMTGNKQLVAVTAQVAEFIQICGLVIFAITKNTGNTAE